jgi:hypothetical protein
MPRNRSRPAIIERALGGEMSHHLGYARGCQDILIAVTDGLEGMSATRRTFASRRSPPAQDDQDPQTLPHDEADRFTATRLWKRRLHSRSSSCQIRRNTEHVNHASHTKTLTLPGSLLPALRAVWLVRIHKYKPPRGASGGLYLWILTSHDAGQGPAAAGCWKIPGSIPP